MDLNKPHKAADIAVTLSEDRPGALARAITAVSRAGINIDGYTEMSGVVHVLTVDLAETLRVLKGAGFQFVQEQDIVLVPVHDKPGAAASVFQRIADAHINVKYSYLATGNRLVIASDDADAVLRAVGDQV